MVYKKLKISKIFLKDSFEIKLCNQNSAFVVALMLNQFEIDDIINKYSGKWDIIYFGNI